MLKLSQKDDESAAPLELSTRARLILFSGSNVSAETVLTWGVAEINVDLLTKHRVTAKEIMAAGVGPRSLKIMGLNDARLLRNLGFDSLHLTDPTFTSEAIAAFGASAVRASFLNGACDAVAISGSDAMHMLDISVNDLLEHCSGMPVEASSVLQQLPYGVSLTGVRPETLLDTGLRKASLKSIGYSLTSVAAQTNADAQQIEKLGYWTPP